MVSRKIRHVAIRSGFYTLDFYNASIIMDFQRSLYQGPNLMNLNCSPTASSNLNHRFFESQIQILLKSLNLKRQYVVQRHIFIKFRPRKNVIFLGLFSYF